MNIEKIKHTIISILKRHSITRAGIFGSFARGNENPDSDIDILVEFDKQISLLEFVGIKYELEDILEKKVDLVEYQSIKPRLKKRIMSEEIRIYG
jgi:predicted nucleotidyltransferase